MSVSYRTLLINQRVIVGEEIGTVVRPDRNTTQAGQIRIFRPSLGYASDFDSLNVQPLPGGQL